jgi:hypothetical protein
VAVGRLPEGLGLQNGLHAGFRADREGRRADLHEFLTRLGSRISQASAPERAALVREFVLSRSKPNADASGKLVFHYEQRRYPDGSFWHAHKTPHVIVHVTYVFPEPGVPRQTDADLRSTVGAQAATGENRRCSAKLAWMSP